MAEEVKKETPEEQAPEKVSESFVWGRHPGESDPDKARAPKPGRVDRGKLSLDEITQRVLDAVQKMLELKPSESSLVHVFDTFVVYEKEGSYYKRGYRLNGGKVELDANEVGVEPAWVETNVREAVASESVVSEGTEAEGAKAEVVSEAAKPEPKVEVPKEEPVEEAAKAEAEAATGEAPSQEEEPKETAECVTDKDFKGGCKHCGYGTLAVMKGKGKCPYCGNKPR